MYGATIKKNKNESFIAGGRGAGESMSVLGTT